MDFNKTINWTAKTYRLFEKFNLGNILPIDNFVDNNFPEFLAKLQTYSKIGKIAVCSTNGKRTTVDMLNQFLSANGNTYITNVEKNSVRYPILTSIILDLAKNEEINSDCSKDYYTMAIDEFELSSYFNSIKFDYLLLNNIFIDQKDFCTLEEKRKKIQEALILNSDCTLIINADEPLLYNIDEANRELITSKKMNKILYGFNKIEIQDRENCIQKNDFQICPICSCELDYKTRNYSHIGQFNCACGFKRQKPDIIADAKIYSDYSFLNVKYKDNKYIFKVPLGGVYNAYNALGVISLALVIGMERKIITHALENYRFLRGRDEKIEYQGKEIKIKEIKNPVSLSESLRELVGTKNQKLVFALNDENTDGDDTSWIWDSNFNSLKNFENRIYVCSNRNDDMALRMKYAGINPSLISMNDSIKNSVKCCFYELEQGERMIIFASPSLINDIYNILDK